MAVKLSYKTRSGNKPVIGTGLFKRKGVPSLTAELTYDSSDGEAELDDNEETKDSSGLNSEKDEGEDHEVMAENRPDDENGDEVNGKTEEDEEEDKHSDKDDDSDEVIMSSSRRNKMRRAHITISSNSSGEDSSIDKRKRRRHRRRSSDSSLAAGNSTGIGTEKTAQEDNEQVEEDEDEDFPVSRKRTSTARKHANSDPRKIEQDAIEHEEIQEDLEDLQSSLRMYLRRAQTIFTLKMCIYG